MCREALPQSQVRHSNRAQRPAVRAAFTGGVTTFAVLLAAGPAFAAEYYVAPTGSDTNAGSMEQPFASLQKGHDVAVAGDTVWLRGGTYRPTRQIRLSRSGTSNSQRIKLWAYPGEVPVIDFTGYVTTNRAADVPAILVTGSWLHLKGLEVTNVPGSSGDHSISAVRSNGGSNNTFELLNLHHIFGPGLFIDGGTGGNLVLNCDSHDNYDEDGSQGDGQNADGFGVHYQETGPSTILRGCRAWMNSDDGYDLISQEVPVTIENSWAVQNGYANGGTVSPSSGNGNGFKVGSSTRGVRHIVANSVAWKNKAAGFYANHSSGGNTWFNNTAYMNAVQYNMLASSAADVNVKIILSGSLVHRMRNNIGFPNRNTNMEGVDSMFNTWDLALTESNDFVSTMDTGYTGPRQPDGSLPNLSFLKLRAESRLIDKGTDVGLPIVGAAADLGAYEFGAVLDGGAGASTGAGGSGGMDASSDGAGAGGSLGSREGGAVVRDSGRDAAPGTGLVDGAPREASTAPDAGGSAGNNGGSGGHGGAGGAGAIDASSAGAAGGPVGTGGSAAGRGGTPPQAGSSGASGLMPDSGLERPMGDEGGCACTVGAKPSRGRVASLLALGGLTLLFARRRRTLNA